jgi:hypothetical protein
MPLAPLHLPSELSVIESVAARFPEAETRARFTALFERLAIEVLKAGSISGAGRILRLRWNETRRILQRR